LCVGEATIAAFALQHKIAKKKENDGENLQKSACKKYAKFFGEMGGGDGRGTHVSSVQAVSMKTSTLTLEEGFQVDPFESNKS
jgi:hypothetical protein